MRADQETPSGWQPTPEPPEHSRTNPTSITRMYGGAPGYPPSGQHPYRGPGDPPPLKRPYSEVEPGEDAVVPTVSAFKTAREQLVIDRQRKQGAGTGGGGGGGTRSTHGPVSTAAYGTHKKSLGTRRGLNSKFVPPVLNRDSEDYSDDTSGGGGGALARRPAAGSSTRSVLQARSHRSKANRLADGCISVE